MKFYPLNIFLSIVFLSAHELAFAQQDPKHNLIARVYEDNDFMNIYGRGSDHWYTNGTRVDLFYSREKKPSSIFYKLSPKPGGNSIAEYGWGIMQAMMSPTNLKKSFFQDKDYEYAGALFVTHSLNFSNPGNKTSFETDWIAGVIGPPSLARQTQMLVHKIGGYAPPRGWEYQLPTDLLMNYNLQVEKGLLGKNSTGLIGEAAINAGTMRDAASLSAELRIGQYNSWFDGKSQRMLSNPEKFMISAAVSPGVDIVLYDALLEGGIFNKNSPVNNGTAYHPMLRRQVLKTHFEFQIVMALHNVGITFTQNTLSKDYKGLTGQNIGNVSLYIRL